MMDVLICNPVLSVFKVLRLFQQKFKGISWKKSFLGGLPHIPMGLLITYFSCVYRKLQNIATEEIISEFSKCKENSFIIDEESVTPGTVSL